MDIPVNEPLSIRSGNTVKWRKSLSDFPANDGWALTYVLTLQSDFSKRLSKAAVQDSADFVTTLTAADTAALPAGTYNLFGSVSKSGERYDVFAGTIEIKPDLAALTTGDHRSDIKRKLDAIEAAIEGKATVDQLSLSINGRSITRYSLAEMLVLRDRLKADYQKELQAERFGQTGINSRRVGVRLVRV